MVKTYEWEIEKMNAKGEFERLGVFIGTKKGYREIKRAFDAYVDTEEGWDSSYRYTQLKEHSVK